MNPILVLAILAICTMPAYAQGQQPDTAKLKADAENMVKIVWQGGGRISLAHS